jgi:hypothetical protein
MAAEARAMLDALMGSDRNADIPKSGQNNLQRKKKSCYDYDICPFYCAWGIDVFELFTNTKSDLGDNPKVVQDDAREEFLSLPDHEKDRLGFEFMLYRKLGDLVRGCDRIVNRNKEKLRVEIAKAAKARGSAGRTIDPATDVNEEMILEAAEVIADLELREEEVSDMLEKLMASRLEWEDIWNQVQKLEKISDATADATTADATADTTADTSGTSNDDNDTDTPKKEIKEEPENETEKNEEKDAETKNHPDKSVEIKELKSKLYRLSADQQKIILSLSILASQTIVPLRDNLQNLNKQLHYVKTDTSSDKTVCEVSGNFMSSRDAEERIAAHYAGKQYVGWKMVRDKVRELQKKYAHGRPGGRGGGGGGGPPHGGQRYGGGHGPPHGYGGGHGHGHRHGYNNPPPMSGSGYGGPPQGYGGPPPSSYNRHDQRRERSRSRDRDGSSSRSRQQRRRSPSPGRWKRDRGYGGRR